MDDTHQFCQWPGLMQVASDCRWPTSRPTWSFEPNTGPIHSATFAGWCEQAWAIWREVADVNPLRVDARGQIRVGMRRIDGPGRILGQSTLPCPQPVSYVTTELDRDERWSADVPTQPGWIDVVTVLAHELGHAIGLGHNEPGNIMAAAYTGPRRVPGPGDIRDLVARYGAARPRGPRPGDPGPLPPLPPPSDPGGPPMPRIPPDAWAVLIQALIAFLRRIFGIPGVVEALQEAIAEALRETDKPK